MTTEELKVVLDKHAKWLHNESGGERANLSSANLSSADLHSANLRFANLSFANLSFANLRSANLRFADLHSADLSFADLSSADLHSADLRSAGLSSADLRSADLSSANLHSADLRSAGLSFADLRSAGLSSANLSFANLRSANLSFAILENARLNAHFVCPDEGAFIAWKKGAEGSIIKLSIPADAQRMTPLVGRKCRAEKAEVLEIKDSDGNEIQECGGTYLTSFIYRKGDTVIPDSYDPDIRIGCSHGIHFFITRQEVVDYDLPGV